MGHVNDTEIAVHKMICGFTPDPRHSELHLSILSSVPSLKVGPAASTNHMWCPVFILVAHRNIKICIIGIYEIVGLRDFMLDCFGAQEDTTHLTKTVWIMFTATGKRHHLIVTLNWRKKKELTSIKDLRSIKYFIYR